MGNTRYWTVPPVPPGLLPDGFRIDVWIADSNADKLVVTGEKPDSVLMPEKQTLQIQN